MEISTSIGQHGESLKNHLFFDSVNQRKELKTDLDYLSDLCSMADACVSLDFRSDIKKLLQSNKVEAKEWFKDCALNSPKSSHRRWALINLSLLECQTAKEAVLKGLSDRCRKVRIAAAFNAGLYCDDDVMKALEDYFKTKKFDFARELITNEIRRLVTILRQKF